jgi:hypothetical protein
MHPVKAAVIGIGAVAAVAGAGVVLATAAGAAGAGSTQRPVAAERQVAAQTVAQRDDEAAARARLSGFAEVPAKLSAGTGTFKATVHEDRIDYVLSYSQLSAPATVAHIHFSQPGVNGGIVIFLCGGGGKPACPPAGGTVTGTITAADVQAIATPGPTDQGVAAGDFAGALRILRSGDGYVNVHSSRFAAGEIRGQIRALGDSRLYAVG